jgi:hypothetical protein
MTNTSGPTTPAGWYADPAGSVNLRWWDGATWTAHFAPRPTPTPAPTPVVQTPPLPQVSAYRPATATGEPYVPFQGSWNQSSQGGGYGGVGEFAQPSQWNTGGAWLLAFSPIITIITIIGLVAAYGSTLSATLATPDNSLTFILPAIQFGVFLLGVLFAAMDRSKLRSFGYLRPASIWWTLLAPWAYLIARGIAVSREVRHGFGPLIAYIISFVGIVLLGIGVAIAIPIILGTQGAASNAAYEVQFIAGLEKGLDENGGHYNVNCPPIIPTTINAQFSCTATDTSTNTAHTLNMEIVQGADGKLTPKLLSVSPPITQ